MPRTVLLTGITGFLAKHIALQLLEAGHTVRGSLRDMARADEVRAALSAHLGDESALDRLDFVTLDLSRDGGWDRALADVDVLMHTASPFPFTQPRDESEVIRPAVDGTRRALSAARASGVGRVIMTSSAVAIMGLVSDGVQTEEDWTNPDDPGITPYVKSKTLAERAAWDIADADPGMALTVINPGFILGPALDAHYGTSLRVIERLLKARDPAVPKVGFSTVDVRDVARMHVAAIGSPETEGKRFMAISDFLWFSDMARILAAAYPDRRIVTREAPNLLMRLIALFDPDMRQLLPSLGKRSKADARRAREVMGMDFRPVDEAVLASARSVIDAGRA